MTECEISEKLDEFIVSKFLIIKLLKKNYLWNLFYDQLTVYNPVGQEIDDFVRFPIVGIGSYLITDSSG